MTVSAIFNNGAPAIHKPDESYLEREKRRRYQHDTAIYHRQASQIMRRMLAGEEFRNAPSLAKWARIVWQKRSWAAINLTPTAVRNEIANHLRSNFEAENPPTIIDPKTRRTWRR